MEPITREQFAAIPHLRVTPELWERSWLWGGIWRRWDEMNQPGDVSEFEPEDQTAPKNVDRHPDPFYNITQVIENANLQGPPSKFRKHIRSPVR